MTANQFLCPITCATMKDPVTDRDGNTFEREAIEAWLTSHGTSPITRNPMTVADLVPNRALRDAIEAAATATAAPAPVAATCPPPEEQTVLPDTSSSMPIQVTMLTDMERGETVVQITGPETPLQGIRRPPVDVCCVLDISGSMDDKASVKNEAGDREYHGLNLLDVVKHATRAVAAMLADNDRIAVVLFTTNARVLLPLTSVTKQNREALFKKLDTVYPENSTNIWAGLELAMNMLRDRNEVDQRQRTGHVLLLTDGQPNVEPPRGHIPTLKRYVEALPGGVAPFAVHTFGFGYSIDTPLLRSIAELMGGLYVFIPDSGLVGTVFVNTASNILCTAATGLTIAVDLSGGRNVVATSSDPALLLPQEDQASSMAHATLGSLQFGQPRSVFIKWAHDPKHTGSQVSPAVVRVNCNGIQSIVVEETVLSATAPNARDVLLLATERCRCDFLHTVEKAYTDCIENQNFGAAKASISDAVKRITPIRAALVEAMVKDLNGEVKAAVGSGENWTKWGRHYLPSLLRANAIQQCNNFKDHSVQCYGGKYYSTLRDEGEKAFLSVPAPVAQVQQAQPQQRPQSGTRGYAAAPAAAAPPQRANMRAYYNQGGGCITGESLVLLKDGSALPAALVAAGMQLHNGATVSCTIRIPIAKNTALVQLDEHLCITQYHPVRLAGNTSWSFPVDCPMGVATTSHTAAYVYTFLLRDGVAVPSAGGTEVVALGHGLDEDHVVAHDYLGTQRVVDDLKLLDGFEKGAVTVGGFVRNSQTMRIAGLMSSPLCPLVA